MVEINDLRPHYQHHYSSSSVDSTATPIRNVTQTRPARPSQAHFDDYMSPEWSPATPGRYGAQYLADTPGDSPAGSPSLSGRATPLEYLPPSSRHLSSIDSRPSTPTNQSHLSLATLLPSSYKRNSGKDWVERDSIARLHDRDDAEIWKGWKRYLFKMVPILVFANTDRKSVV